MGETLQIAFIAILFFLLYIPPIIAIRQVGTLNGAATANCNLSIWKYSIAEIQICLGVGAVSILQSYLNTLDYSRMANWSIWWRTEVLFLEWFGILLGFLLLYEGLHFRRAGQKLCIFFCWFGAACLFYSFVLPDLMNNYMDAMLQSHIIG